MRALWLPLIFCIIAILSGCSARADKRFATPKDTIETLFSTYGVQQMSEEEVRRRMEARERFTMLDPELHRACFADWRSDSDQGIAGFVFGRLVAAKDHLTTKIEGDRATVIATESKGPEEPVVLQRGKAGWKIVLQQSAPESVKRQLYEVYRRAKKVETRSLPPPTGLSQPLP